MSVAGWREGFDPAFTIVPGTARNASTFFAWWLESLMLAASLDWFIDATTLLREPASQFPATQSQEATA